MYAALCEYASHVFQNLCTSQRFFLFANFSRTHIWGSYTNRTVDKTEACCC